MSKLTKQEAKKVAQRNGISFNVDYHSLSSSKVDILSQLAKQVGYRKPASASGSKTRYFFYYLAKVK